MAVQSFMPALGNKATTFDLKTANPWIDIIEGETRSFESYPEASIYVVVFTCNHCPYAIHVESTLINIANNYADKGVQFIAICSNDPVTYPTDDFDSMATRAREVNMPFPYLWDETQDIANAYGAACTPDIFVYDADLVMQYRGRVDETRPNMGTAHGADLTAALDQILSTGKGPENQYPSVGCSIKWRRGNAPH